MKHPNIKQIMSKVRSFPGMPATAGKLLPLLKNPVAKWDRPALTTHGRNNHSLRGERFRYIRYSDGTEELYDHDKDALEWTNLANDPKYAAVKKAFAKWLPTDDAPQVSKPRAKKKNKK